MPAIKVTVMVEVDGVVPQGFPLTRRVVVDQWSQFNFVKAGGDVLPPTAGLPIPVTDPVQVMLIAPASREVRVEFNDTPDGYATVNPGGLMLLVDGDAGSDASIHIANETAEPTIVIGLAGGTAS